MRHISIILLFSLSQICIAQTEFSCRLVNAALDLTKQQVDYDPQYYVISYPNGDVPSDKGVCTDVVVRAYRKAGIDLQKEVHEDMEAEFSAYPANWGSSHTDTNIDHRRVPNLMTFFSRKGTTLKITQNPEDYMPGDIVCWDLGGGITHIGIVVNIKSANGNQFQIVHNIGYGQVLADCLFDFRIIGHYRYSLEASEALPRDSCEISPLPADSYVTSGNNWGLFFDFAACNNSNHAFLIKSCPLKPFICQKCALSNIQYYASL